MIVTQGYWQKERDLPLLEWPHYEYVQYDGVLSYSSRMKKERHQLVMSHSWHAQVHSNQLLHLVERLSVIEQFVGA